MVVSPQPAGASHDASTTTLAEQLGRWRWGEGCWGDRSRSEGGTVAGGGTRAERARHADSRGQGGGRSPSRRSTVEGRRQASRWVREVASSAAVARRRRSGRRRVRLQVGGRLQGSSYPSCYLGRTMCVPWVAHSRLCSNTILSVVARSDAVRSLRLLRNREVKGGCF